jgi:hypothetical protein
VLCSRWLRDLGFISSRLKSSKVPSARKEVQSNLPAAFEADCSSWALEKGLSNPWPRTTTVIGIRN